MLENYDAGAVEDILAVFVDPGRHVPARVSVLLDFLAERVAQDLACPLSRAAIRPQSELGRILQQRIGHGVATGKTIAAYKAEHYGQHLIVAGAVVRIQHHDFIGLRAIDLAGVAQTSHVLVRCRLPSLALREVHRYSHNINERSVASDATLLMTDRSFLPSKSCDQSATAPGSGLSQPGRPAKRFVRPLHGRLTGHK
ncbi:hypothetical protein AVKW3434_21980 [Acidovorax sp. SUPP3434]|nr:hypothetical protein AVKW3434_21980 [Acidovorax sp. SUPP3434]